MLPGIERQPRNKLEPIDDYVRRSARHTHQVYAEIARLFGGTDVVSVQFTDPADGMTPLVASVAPASRGTAGLQTHRWREPDSNLRSHPTASGGT
jgi:hypothetical protein